jgi:hypothetical protein
MILTLIGFKPNNDYKFRVWFDFKYMAVSTISIKNGLGIEVYKLEAPRRGFWVFLNLFRVCFNIRVGRG